MSSCRGGHYKTENALLEGPTTVRYPEDKIKEAILHPDANIRDRATSYFSKSSSSKSLHAAPSAVNRLPVLQSIRKPGATSSTDFIKSANHSSMSAKRSFSK